MIEIMKESAGNFLAVRATGKARHVDYSEKLLPMLDALFEKHGKLNILFYMDKDFKGWDFSGAWDDAFLGLKHRSDFDKIAVVGGPDWVHWCIKFSGFLMKGEIRIFTVDALAEAMSWARN